MDMGKSQTSSKPLSIEEFAVLIKQLMPEQRKRLLEYAIELDKETNYV